MNKRICLFCHKVGITIFFKNGNQLKKHVRDKHPRTAAEIARDRESLRQYRKKVLMMHARYGARDYPL
jgi:hypothetical protein